MNYRYFKYLCLLFLLLSSCFLFAQGNDLQIKLNSFKAKNDLTSWVYEQLDYANVNSEKAITLLQNAQKKTLENY